MGKSKLKAIIADDEMHIRLYLRRILESMNMEVVGEATNGKEAIELFRKEKPHFLLLDLNMPVKNGDEALKEIMIEFPEALVIILTATVDKTTVENLIDLGASNFIRKDTSIAEMKKILKGTWDSYRTTRK